MSYQAHWHWCLTFAVLYVLLVLVVCLYTFVREPVPAITSPVPAATGTERVVTLFDIPMCANDVGMGRCNDCVRRVDRARMRQRRRIRRRMRRASRVDR